MSGDSRRSRGRDDGQEADEWLIDAARRAGHKLPAKERPSGTSAWRVLLNAGLADDEVLRLACSGSGADPADFTQLNPALADLLSHGVALKHRVAPLGVHRGTLGVATSNPRNPDLERDLAFAAKQRVRLFAASPSDVIRAQGMVYGAIYESRSALSTPASAPAAASAAPEPRPARPPRRSLPMTLPVDMDDVEALTLQVEPDLVLPVPEPESPALELPAERVEEFAIERASEASPVATQPERKPEPEPEPEPEPSPAETPAAPPPDISARLFATAVAAHASDAILEPAADGCILVRLRVAGSLHDRFRIPEAQAPRLVQTLKQRARLDDSVTTPQRGRVTFDSPKGPIVVRISTEPAGGTRERVSLRFVTARDLRGVAELGLASEELARVQSLLVAASGLLVVTGPPGAGTTTTAYAMARALTDAGRRVATVERLAEYPLSGIAQAQTGDRISTASAVNGALATEGDVILIGAPLDASTLREVRVATSRSRLVIASLETPDLASTLAALQALTADDARLATMLGGVVVQRLLRRLCSACAVTQEPGELTDHQQQLLHGLSMASLRRAAGCPACHGTGYLGRIAIAQVVRMTPGLRVAIRHGASAAELARLASDSGAPTLWASGLDRVLHGITSLAELVDTVPPPTDDGGTAPQDDIDALLTQLLSLPAPMPELPEVAALTVTGEHPTPRPSPVVTFELVSDGDEPPAPAPCILVVDDDPSARRLLAQSLAAHGLRVLQAADGNSALAFARQLRPDVILTEVALPGLDAVELLGALATSGVAVPVVVHTDQDEESLREWLMESGARTVLRRDTEIAELVRQLRALAQPPSIT